MERATSLVKDLKKLVRPRNGRIPTLESIDEEDSPVTPKKFEKYFLEGECVSPIYKNSLMF